MRVVGARNNEKKKGTSQRPPSPLLDKMSVPGELPRRLFDAREGEPIMSPSLPNWRRLMHDGWLTDRNGSVPGLAVLVVESCDFNLHPSISVSQILRDGRRDSTARLSAYSAVYVGTHYSVAMS
jgi:hypothetical protein